MGEPITIVVNAQTDAALKNLAAFLGQTQAGIKAVQVEAVKLKTVLNDSFTALPSSANAAVPAVRRAGEELGKLGLKAGQSRLAMMEMGHVIRATAESLAVGIPPGRILAFELPRIAQAASMAGFSLTTLAAGVAALTPIVLSGAAAWSAYKAELDEVATAQALVEQRGDLRARLTTLLTSNADRMKDGEASALRQRLIDATESGSVTTGPRVIAGQGRSARVISEGTTRKTEILADVIKEVQARLQLVNLTDDQKKQLAEIDQITLKSFANSLSGYEKEREEATQENRAIKEKIALNGASAKTDEDRRRVQQAYDFQRQAFAEKMAEIDKREAKDKSDDQAKEVQKSRAIFALRQGLARAGQSGLQVDLDEIDSKYDREIERIQDLKLSLEQELQLIKEINVARDAEKDAAIGTYQEKQTQVQKLESQKRVQIQQDELNSTASLLGSAADAARLFGREGFIAWKAIALAQAVVSGASAVLLQLGGGDPYSAPFRAAAAAATAAIQIAVIAATQPSGYAEGGYTGDGGKYQAAGVVHRGEFVMNATRTAQFRPVLEAMHAGQMPAMTSGTGGGNVHVASPDVHVIVVNDRQEHLRALESLAARGIIAKQVNASRLDLGMQT